IISAKPHSIHRGETIQLGSIVGASDGNGDLISKFQVRDDTTDAGSGFLALDDVRINAGSPFDLTPSEFGRLQFTGGASAVATVSDYITVRAFDGIGWSDWTPVVITTLPANDRPVITASSRTIEPGQRISFADLVSISDNNNDAIVTYQFRDHNAEQRSGF